MKNLVVCSVLLTGIRALGILFQALVILYLARSLSIEDMGLFAMAYAWLGFMRMLGPLGSDQIALRRISGEGGKTPAAQSISNTSFALTCLVGFGVALIASAVLVRISPFTRIEIMAIGLATPAFALMGLFTSQIRGFGRNLTAQAPEALGFHLLFGGLIALFALEGFVELTAVLFCLCAAGWGVTSLYLILRIRIGVDWSRIPQPGDIGCLAAEGFTIFQAMLLTALSVRAPIFLAGALTGPADAGVLEIATRFGNLASITTTSVGATFAPQFARLAHQSDSANLMKSLRLGAILAALPALGWLGVLCLAASTAVSTMLPPAYADAHASMLIVALAASLNAAFGLSGTLSLMTGSARILRLFSMAQLCVICLGSLAFVPNYGTTGITWAMVMGVLVRDGGMMVFIVSCISIKLSE